jgi:pyruvate-formate lyase-activating enzyme
MSNEEQIIKLQKRRKAINNISPCFCTAKWLQTTLYLQNGYTHSCHHPAPHKISLEELAENPMALFNGHHRKEQRTMMKNGVRPPECEYCWKIEDLNTEYFSDRHYKSADDFGWDRFPEIVKKNPDQDVYPAYLEVSFSNACNFKCVYCSPEISSKWLDEIKQYGPYPVFRGNHNLDWLESTGRYPISVTQANPYVDAFWQVLPDALPKLRVFRITGGEPLMSKETWRLFEFLKANPQPKLELAINSNLCVPQQLIDQFIDNINQLKGSVKKIDLYTSLESTGTQAEYARFGLDYKQWQSNIRNVLDETDSTVSIMTTVNILSMPTFVDFIEEVMQLRKEYNTDFAHNRIPLSINYLRWPPHLSVKLLPYSVRQDYAKTILTSCESWIKYYRKEKFARLYLEEWDQIKRFCDWLLQDEPLTNEHQDFASYIGELDLRRGTDFAQVFPEYADLLKEWNA